MAIQDLFELPLSVFMLGLVGFSCAIYIVRSIADAIVNVFFSPLSEFPGPKLAAATTWWSAYQQAIRGRSMHHICIELHEKYGDIVRIGPNRLHFNHPSMYDEIYRRRWDKDPFMYALLGGDGATVTFVKYEDNKRRKDILHTFFAKSSVYNVQWLIQENIEKFCGHLTKHNERGVSSDMTLGFRCLGLETITATCFGKSASCFEHEGFASPILEAMESIVTWFMVFKHFGLFRRVILSIPEWVGLALFPKAIAFAQMRKMFSDQIDEITMNLDKANQYPHPIVYRALIRPEKKDTPIPSRASLLEEAVALVIAGTDTTGSTLTIGTYQVLRKPEIYTKLKAELLEAWPNLEQRPNAGDLEKLPYLTAVIKEALRMAPTTTSENSRVVQAQGATIGGKHIPGGTIVSMGVLFPMQHEDAFTDAHVYNPERWLSDDAKALDKYFVPFSKGPRSCLGINLAWCELYLSFANLFRRFDLAIDGTEDSDFNWVDVGLALFEGHLRCFCTPVSS
ncbi:uncharacterized protein N7477_004277 [Penicillium maclennaniae]|uniref:uncharacterized protein n=1 Tax=Penicillium maclennaniae TaxID=1343394 RepID=UPI0025410B14|nr:uncharacterized protein N7477_004277 [Penicillium maclennaniae]KAJ5674343.1 hypothetical protein N7477_004277 [Penicillium maclennaniae]